MPLLQRSMPKGHSYDMPPPGFTSSQSNQVSQLDNSVRNRWVPSCRHWCIDLNHKQLPILSATPRALRYYWLQQDRETSHLQHHYHHNRILTPAVVPHGYCTPRVWRIFWSLSLPHKVFTCWWCLLKDSIGSQNYFHSLSSLHWPSPICRICHNTVETTYHFFVSCSYKWFFWQAASHQLSLNEILESPESVWSILVSLHDLRRRPIDTDQLVKTGCILNALWLMHWNCIYRNEEWSQSAVLGMLSSNTSLDIILNPQEDTE